MRKFFVFSLLLFFAVTGLFGQLPSVRTRELSEAISSGNVTLTANGNGGSTGAVVVGSLRNNTAGEIHINVIINNGIYLRNSGSGQNMIAAQVFLSGGRYTTSGTTKYISLLPNASAQITFIAFCADFERENPTAMQTFTSASIPSGIQAISEKISRFMADNFDTGLIVPIQLALWRAQGQTRSAIEQKFDFDDSDWEISTGIINY